MSDRLDEYRQKRDECLDQAKRARTSADKAQWLRIGEEWAKLADAADHAATRAASDAPQPQK